MRGIFYKTFEKGFLKKEGKIVFLNGIQKESKGSPTF